MIILWIRKNKKELQSPSQKDEKQAFKEHDEVMKKFREAHQQLDRITDKDIITGKGNLLAPVHSVKLSDHIQN